MQNTWMVIAFKSTNGAITCNGVRKDIKIKDTLLIKIKDECTLRTKETMLRGERKSIISVKSKFLKTVEPSVANTKITSETKAYAPIEPMLNIADSFFDRRTRNDIIQQDTPRETACNSYNCGYHSDN
jgi:hypothetical protein